MITSVLSRFFMNHSVYRISRAYSPTVENQLDPFSRFDGTPACNRQTDRHRVIAYTALCICVAYTSRGKGRLYHLCTRYTHNTISFLQ